MRNIGLGRSRLLLLLLFPLTLVVAEAWLLQDWQGGSFLFFSPPSRSTSSSSAFLSSSSSLGQAVPFGGATNSLSSSSSIIPKRRQKNTAPAAAIIFAPAAIADDSSVVLVKEQEEVVDYYSWTGGASACPNNPWELLTPDNRIFEHNCRGLDVSVRWNAREETSQQVAERWMDAIVAAIIPSSGKKSAAQRYHAPRMRNELSRSLDMFVRFCQEHHNSSNGGNNHQETSRSCCPSFSARIVSSRGSAGTRCPQWHVDHVPVRWIQSLVGPGCEYIADDGSSGVRWDLINGLNGNDDDDDDDDDDRGISSLSVSERNDRLVDPSRATIGRGRPGQALMLIGNRWNEFVSGGGDGGGGSSIVEGAPTTTTDASSIVHNAIKPAIHKSPDHLKPWQGRVLLTIDVLWEEQQQQ